MHSLFWVSAMGSPEWLSKEPCVGSGWLSLDGPLLPCVYFLGIPSWVWRSGAEHLPGDRAAAVYKLCPGRVRCGRKRLCCPEEWHQQLCLWSRIYLISSGLLGATGHLPVFLLSPGSQWKTVSLWFWVKLLSVFSFCLCGCAVQQSTFSGEGSSAQIFPAVWTFGCFLWTGESSNLPWASFRFIGGPSLQIYEGFFALVIT